MNEPTMIDNAKWLEGYASYGRDDGCPWGDESLRSGWLAARWQSKPLTEQMEFDHVIEVLTGGTTRERLDISAPELWGASGKPEEVEGWELLNGYSGQDRYAGPIMHNSEQLAGGIADEIRSTPGVYVALLCQWMPESEDEDEEIVVEGWAVARKI